MQKRQQWREVCMYTHCNTKVQVAISKLNQGNRGNLPVSLPSPLSYSPRM